MNAAAARADQPPVPNRSAAGGRDVQRSNVYAAEQLVHRVLDRARDSPTLEIAGSRLTLPPERRFADLPSVQVYVDRVLALDLVLRQWAGSGPVTVRARAGTGKAHYEPATPNREPATIALPGVVHGDRWALRELVVLHEVAHHLGAGAGAAHHDAGFVARYLELVEAVVGPEVAFVLRVTMLEAGVAIG